LLSINFLKVYKGRNCSIGSAILKRFNLFFDYTYAKLYLKKNSFFREAFTYNNSGVVLEYNGNMFVKEEMKLPPIGYFDSDTGRDAIQINLAINYTMVLKPTYKIAEVRLYSNAYETGLRVGDILIEFNRKQAYNLKLDEINKVLHGKTGTRISLKIEREGKVLPFKFKLDNVFKKNEPSD
jgi:C-terminal processing protease CtpA/Prc